MARGGEPAGVVVFHRPARSWPEPVPTEAVVVAAPPSMAPKQDRPLVQILLPLAGSVGVIALAFAIKGVAFLVVSACIAVLTIGMSLLVVRQQKRAAAAKRARNAELYRSYLAGRRERLEHVAAAQRHAAGRLHPDPERLPVLAAGRAHLWERRREDEDFLEVRLGLGAVPLAAPVTLDLAGDPLTEYEPDLIGEAKALVDAYALLAPVPVTASLTGLGSIAVVGDRAMAQGFARAICCQLAVWQPPDDLRIAAWFEPGQEPAWDWMKWLPHARDHSAALGEDAGQAVALTVDVADLEVLLSRLVTPRLEHLDRVASGDPLRFGPGRVLAPSGQAGARRAGGGRSDSHVAFQPVVLLLDGYDPGAPIGRLPLVEQLFERAAELGVLVLALAATPDMVPSRVGAIAELSADGRLAWTEAGPRGRRERNVHADVITPGRCEAAARALAPLVLRAERARAATVDTQGLLDLLELSAPGGLDLAAALPARSAEKLLATVIGIGDDAAPVVLDLKEAAEGGMGPHGLVVGATGSGKSELLRTLVTGLACTHTPEELALVLVDYKGGATFAELARLPHVAGVITNLERDPALVDRMHEALFGELERRQRVLADASLDRVRDYQQEWRLQGSWHRPGASGGGTPDFFAAPGFAGEAGRDPLGEPWLEPLPSLLVIVDEFGELLTARPDFTDLFVSIGRTGRSLGIHLLLSTQRLDEGRIRGLESHLRYRVCLRTFSPEESLTALGTRDAFDLPPLPGLGYLKVDAGMRRFKAALSTRPYREHRGAAQVGGVVRAFDIGGALTELAVVGNGGGPLGLPPHEEAGQDVPAPDGRFDRPATRPGAGAPLDHDEAAEGGQRGQATRRVRTDLQVAVERIAAASAGRRVRQVWLPPLPAALSLDGLLDAGMAEMGQSGTGVGGQGALTGRAGPVVVDGEAPSMRGGIATVTGVVTSGVGPEGTSAGLVHGGRPPVPGSAGAPPTIGRPAGGPGAVAVAPGRTARARPGGPGWLRVPLGVIDLPRDQAQRPFVLDFTGTAGHLAVVGAPRSGKSTLLQTLLAALSLTHDPAQTQVYAADLGGGRLHALAGLPHVGAVYGRGDREALRRLVRELRALVDERAADFRRLRLDGMAAYHAARADGRVVSEHGEVFLVVDNWGLFAGELPELADQVQELAAAGLHYGVHLVLAANRWNDLRLTLRDNVGGRLELRLNDPVESEIDRHASRSLPTDQPGRGLAPDGVCFQAALPRVDGVGDIGGLAHGIETLVAQVTADWRGGGAAPPIHMLPDEVAEAALPDPAGDRLPGVALGLEEFGLRPVRLDLFGGEPHFLVLGDGESGKTTLLRGWLRRLAARYGPDEARVAVVDYRRQLVDEVEGPNTYAYACTPGMVATLAERLTNDLAERMPDGELTAAALRQPRTWTGPELVLVIDDYDLVASGLNNPIAGLADLLAQGRDIGFHLVLARRVGGFARNAFEPLLQRMRELAVPGLILSGDALEGPLLGGVKAQPAVPGRGCLIRDRATVLVQIAKFAPRYGQGHAATRAAAAAAPSPHQAAERARVDAGAVAPGVAGLVAGPRPGQGGEAGHDLARPTAWSPRGA